jgi:hypothetical protein
LLGAVERVEETGEGPCVRREIVYPGKIPDHFAHHSGLAGVLPFVEEVIVNADGEQIVSALRTQLGGTDLLPKKELERKLHEAVRLARTRLGVAKE